jgi:hypothetical protein
MKFFLENLYKEFDKWKNYIKKISQSNILTPGVNIYFDTK